MKPAKIVASKKISENIMILYFDDFSMRTLTLIDDSEAWRTLGYLCPYCLKIFKSHQGLQRDHMYLHHGPVKCVSCKVGLC